MDWSAVGRDVFYEAIVLGIDAIIFGVCLSSYRYNKRTLGALKVRHFGELNL